MKSRSFNLLVILALFLSLFGSAATFTQAQAATFTVTTASDSGAGSLRQAIIDANATPAADEINFNADYTITLSSQLPAVTTPITITGNGATKTIIQANAAADVANYRVFEVQGTGNLTLNSLTVRHGRCWGLCAASNTDGGGILNSGTLTVTNSAVSNNIALQLGGGILNHGTLTVTNSTISGNSGARGGGIKNTGNVLSVANSMISGNDASSNGGGIDNSGTMTVTNSIISGNNCLVAFACGGGGGIINEGGTLTVTNSTISGNTANGSSGGGIFAIGGTLIITNSVISGNSAPTGGGIQNNSGNLSLINSTISANTATVSGGGIENVVKAAITNSTFSDNKSLGGGAGGIANSGTLDFANTIIANSTGADCGGGTIGINTNNLTEDGSCSATLSGDPLLGPLADNGGPTKTYALLSGSPAIDAGNAAACSSSLVSNKDQRGATRPQGVGCDIGAFELDATSPSVLMTSLQPTYTTSGPASFTVNFSENLNDPTGNTDIKDVTNPANYLVIEKGNNGTADTVSCKSGVQADDTNVPVASVTFNTSLFTATVNFTSTLPNGSYRLFVCGTTSIRDIALNPLNGGTSDFTFDFTVGAATTSSSSSGTSRFRLPGTGFAPSTITSLPQQPADLAYTELGDLWLEIPSLNLKTNIVGVPLGEKNVWDVKWLGMDAGWLNDTAFPTWTGNSVITGHVYGADGLPGLFVNLKDLRKGDQVIVHMGGEKYIFEVQKSKLVRPDTTAFAFEHLEKNSYLTLITCSGYNEQNGSYRFRRVVRAVLVDVQAE